MPATYEPCPDCAGLGHVCDEAADHIHTHEPAPICDDCGGRGSVPIADVAEPDDDSGSDDDESDDDSPDDKPEGQE